MRLSHGLAAAAAFSTLRGWHAAAHAAEAGAAAVSGSGVGGALRGPGGGVGGGPADSGAGAAGLKILTDEAAAARALHPDAGSLLTPLLIPRTPGSPGSRRVQQFLVDHFTRLGWHAAAEPFTAHTPHGPLAMANVVVRRNATAGPARVTLAAHYDSKLEPAGFVGAIDSAVPCALLLWAAEALAAAGVDADVDFIFFDGEEAMVEWSDDDSLYGARHAAAEAERTGTLPQLLVLLDLLGHRDDTTVVPSWFPETHAVFQELERINAELVAAGRVARPLLGGELHRFKGYMLDDHIPYWRRGVPVVHVIPPRFPAVWHTAEDTAANLDWKTIFDWSQILNTWLTRHAAITISQSPPAAPAAPATPAGSGAPGKDEL